MLPDLEGGYQDSNDGKTNERQESDLSGLSLLFALTELAAPLSSKASLSSHNRLYTV